MIAPKSVSKRHIASLEKQEHAFTNSLPTKGERKDIPLHFSIEINDEDTR
jgi:hypothetical protein